MSAPLARFPEGAQWFRLELPSDASGLRVVSHGLRCFLRATGWGRSDCFRLDLAVNEAIENAITHGNLNRRERLVTLEVCDDGEVLTVDVLDEGLGQGFDPEKLQPLSERNLALAERGRGVALMRRLMDGFEVIREARGTRVRMLKRKPAAFEWRQAV